MRASACSVGFGYFALIFFPCFAWRYPAILFWDDPYEASGSVLGVRVPRKTACKPNRMVDDGSVCRLDAGLSHRFKENGICLFARCGLLPVEIIMHYRRPLIRPCGKVAGPEGAGDAREVGDETARHDNGPLAAFEVEILAEHEISPVAEWDHGHRRERGATRRYAARCRDSHEENDRREPVDPLPVRKTFHGKQS